MGLSFYLFWSSSSLCPAENGYEENHLIWRIFRIRETILQNPFHNDTYLVFAFALIQDDNPLLFAFARVNQPLKPYSHQAKAAVKATKIQSKNKQKDQRINCKHQRNFLLSLSLV